MRPINADTLRIKYEQKANEWRGKGVLPSMESLMWDAAISMLDEAMTIDVIPVVFCKDCQHCRLLDDGESFSCQESEMDYYAPTYSAATYYCADGKRRDDPCI